MPKTSEMSKTYEVGIRKEEGFMTFNIKADKMSLGPDGMSFLDQNNVVLAHVPQFAWVTEQVDELD